MVEIKITYEGDLHCSAIHGPSGTSLTTDAPVDNQGRGESFSPTDLVATALGACISTILGIVSKRKNLDIEGLSVTVQKHMSDSGPRRISRLVVHLQIPLPFDHAERPMLEASAHSCPVFASIHPDILVELIWQWID